MGKLSAQVQLYIGIALIVVVALAAVFLGIMPLFQSASDADAQIAAEQTNLATAQALLARRQSAKAQSAGNEVELMRLANELPDSPQLPSVIVELQDVANASGVDLLSITPGMPAPGTALPAGTPSVAYEVLPLSVLVQGEWVELIDYFQRIRNLDRGVRVVSTTFTYVPGTEDEKAYIESSVMLEVYMMAASTTDTNAAATQPAVTTP